MLDFGVISSLADEPKLAAGVPASAADATPANAAAAEAAAAFVALIDMSDEAMGPLSDGRVYEPDLGSELTAHPSVVPPPMWPTALPLAANSTGDRGSALPSPADLPPPAVTVPAAQPTDVDPAALAFAAPIKPRLSVSDVPARRWHLQPIEPVRPVPIDMPEPAGAATPPAGASAAVAPAEAATHSEMPLPAVPVPVPQPTDVDPAALAFAAPIKPRLSVSDVPARRWHAQPVEAPTPVSTGQLEPSGESMPLATPRALGQAGGPAAEAPPDTTEESPVPRSELTPSDLPMPALPIFVPQPTEVDSTTLAFATPIKATHVGADVPGRRWHAQPVEAPAPVSRRELRPSELPMPAVPIGVPQPTAIDSTTLAFVAPIKATRSASDAPTRPWHSQPIESPALVPTGQPAQTPALPSPSPSLAPRAMPLPMPTPSAGAIEWTSPVRAPNGPPAIPVGVLPPVLFQAEPPQAASSNVADIPPAERRRVTSASFVVEPADDSPAHGPWTSTWLARAIHAAEPVADVSFAPLEPAVLGYLTAPLGAGLPPRVMPAPTPVPFPSSLRESTLPEGTADQVVQALRLQWSRGVGEAHIRLQPDQFGQLSVSLRVESGQVVARLEADAPAVREWLQANHATLRSALAEHHLELDRLEVAEPQPDADARRQGRDERPSQHAFDFERQRRRASVDSGAARFEVVV